MPPRILVIGLDIQNDSIDSYRRVESAPSLFDYDIVIIDIDATLPASLDDQIPSDSYLTIKNTQPIRNTFSRTIDKLKKECELLFEKGGSLVCLLKPKRGIRARGSISLAIHKLFIKAGLIEKGTKQRYELRAHSIRKFFRTQLGSLGTIPTDYIEYMMGHTISTYNDVRMKGITFLRNLYTASGLSIKPKTKVSKIDQLKLIIEAWGLDPHEILSREALAKPHRTIMDPESETIRVLNQTLKHTILQELQQQT